MRAVVASIGGGRYVWTFDAPYDDAAAGTWSPADFDGLRVAGLEPGGIDEVIGVDGTLTLVYPVQDPNAPAMFDVDAAPAVLSFAGGRALAVPQNGNVTPWRVMNPDAGPRPMRLRAGAFFWPGAAIYHVASCIWRGLQGSLGVYVASPGIG